MIKSLLMTAIATGGLLMTGCAARQPADPIQQVLAQQRIELQQKRQALASIRDENQKSGLYAAYFSQPIDNRKATNKRAKRRPIPALGSSSGTNNTYPDYGNSNTFRP